MRGVIPLKLGGRSVRGQRLAVIPQTPGGPIREGSEARCDPSKARGTDP
ncbi:hypothetical protein SAMN04488123_10412 [Natribacillus halophilus]|uniref:Uncharacterized protein n=1 Tax=Natribacillus halophilus TaxID=549003 RepID=A0A1G8M7M6_9BACI|nr:hypothetical protein SAMN04488123_10412 [Natribacillus halophilus]